MLNKYPAIGSTCRQPLPTSVSVCGKPFMRMEDWNFFSKVLIQCIYFGESANFCSLIFMNSEEMLSNASENSISNISPSRLLYFAV